MLFATRLLYWVLWWIWYTVLLGGIGFTVAFLGFKYGQPVIGVAAVVVTVVLIAISMRQRAKELKRVREARKKAATKSVWS